MSKKQLKNLFTLDGYVLDKVENLKNEILLHCHIQKQTMKCKSEVSRKINTTRLRKITHSIFESKKVFILIKQRKFYFPKHKKILWESLPQVKPRQQQTITFKKTL